MLYAPVYPQRKVYRNIRNAYIYICIYTERDRNRQREREREIERERGRESSKAKIHAPEAFRILHCSEEICLLPADAAFSLSLACPTVHATSDEDVLGYSL